MSAARRDSGWLRNGAAALTALAGAPVLAVGCALRPSWRDGLSERLGLRGPRARGAIWVHGASVGEILAATRLLDALEERGHRVRASTTTSAGRAVLGRQRPAVEVGYAPLDHPWAAEASMARSLPVALVLIESELWPVWIATAARRGVPVAVVSARISDRSFERYRRLGRLRPRAFRRLTAVGARTSTDAERFVALGTPAERVSVTGDLKVEPPAVAPVLAPDLDALLGDAAPFVAASTHAGEEDAALTALDAADAAGVPIRLILAPRRLDRVDEVVALVERRGRSVLRRSRTSGASWRADQVLVLDTLGELSALMSRGRIVFVGGTLAPVGGHNVLEPALAGRPVLFGPNTDHVRDAAELLIASGAARRVSNASELAAALVAWLCDPTEARQRGEAGRRVLEGHRGATARSVALVERVLPAPAGADS